MILDRYTKAVLTAIALALAAIAIHPWVAPGPAEAQRRKEISLPAGWGKVVGFSDGYGLFEASDGTLRLVGLGSGSVTQLARRR